MQKKVIEFWLAFLICLAVCHANAATHYLVPTNTAAANPFDSWVTAGTSVIDVVKAAMTNATTPRTVWATNGVYVLTNDVTITNDVALKGVNGRDATIFNGSKLYHFVMRHTNCVLDSLTVTNGFSSVGGGGILVMCGTVTNCLVTTCANADRFGAGICIANGSVVNSTISGNTNKNGGGGIAIGYYVPDGNPMYATGRVENCIVRDNYVTDQGGGIRIGSHGQYSSSVVAVVKSCLVMNNFVDQTASRYGGGMFICATNVLVANCTIVSNYATRAGGGIAFYADSDRGDIVVNCVIVSNNCTGSVQPTDFDTRNIRRASGATWTNAVAYSCSTSNTYFVLNGRGNTTNDPGFTDFTGGNYRFKRTSPCFNSGTNQLDWMNSAADLAGNMRLRFGRADMGAYEWYPRIKINGVAYEKIRLVNGNETYKFNGVP